MAAYLIEQIPVRATDTNGAPVPYARRHTYAAGTTTPLATYTDSDGVTPLPNPVIADAGGYFPQVWVQLAAYKFEDRKADDTTVLWQRDKLRPAQLAIESFKTDLLDATTLTKGVALVGGAPRAVNSISDLRTLPVAGSKHALVLGYYTHGDGGGGLFFYDASDTTTVDNACTVIVAADGGRWKLSTQAELNIRQFGAKGDGTTDDTANLQVAITYCRLQAGNKLKLRWNTGTYKVTNYLEIGSNQYIEFEQGVVIDATGLPNETTSLFSMANQSGVIMNGNGAQLNGARATAGALIEGNSAAFFIYGSDNVTIRNFNISGFATDGITISGDLTGSGPSTNVRIENCDSYNNRRNGLSIVHAQGLVVDGGRYWNSNGAPNGPWAGIDIEPNAGQVVQDVVLLAVRTQANAGAGIQFTPGAMSSSSGLLYDISVVGGHSVGDGSVTGTPSLRFANGGTQANEILGQIVVRDYVIESPKSMGVSFSNWDAFNSPRVLLENVEVINPDGTSNAATNVQRTGFVVYCDSAQAITSLGKITMRNCKAQDFRGTPRMVWGAFIQADAGKAIQDVYIDNFTAVNYTAASKYPVNTAIGAGTFADVVVHYPNPKTVASSVSLSDSGWGGQRVKLTTGGSTFTLPLAAKCRAMYYEVAADAAAGTPCSVLVAGSDKIKTLGVAVATSLTLQPGDVARFRSDGTATWLTAAVA